MKSIFIIVGIISILFGCSSVVSDINPIIGEVGSRIVEIENTTKDDLFVNANSWAVDTFVSAESVIEYQDKEAGVIKGKYVTSIVDGMYFLDVKTIITIEVKEGKARILLTDPQKRFTGNMLGGKGIMPYEPITSKSTKEKMQTKWEGLLDSFETAM